MPRRGTLVVERPPWSSLLRIRGGTCSEQDSATTLCTLTYPLAQFKDPSIYITTSKAALLTLNRIEGPQENRAQVEQSARDCVNSLYHHFGACRERAWRLGINNPRSLIRGPKWESRLPLIGDSVK